MIHKRANNHDEQENESVSFNKCPNHVFYPVKEREKRFMSLQYCGPWRSFMARNGPTDRVLARTPVDGGKSEIYL